MADSFSDNTMQGRSSGNTRIIGANELQKSIDSLGRVVTSLSGVVAKLPQGAQNAFGAAARGGTSLGGHRRASSSADLPRGNISSNFIGKAFDWGNVGGNVTFGGGANHAEAHAANRIVGGMNRGGLSTGTPGASGTPAPRMSSGMANGGGPTFNGAPMGSGPSTAVGGSLLSGGAAAGMVGGIAGVLNASKDMGAYMMSSDRMLPDYAIRRMMMMNNQSYSANQQFMYGDSSGQGGFNGIATSHKDAAGAMMITRRVAGSDIRYGGGAQQFQRSVQGVGYADPTLGATGAAKYTGQMYTPNAVMKSMALGMPTIGMSGKRMSAMQQSTQLVNRVMPKGSSMAEIQNSLKQGYGLDASIQTLAAQTGQDPAEMSEIIRAQAAIADKNKTTFAKAGTILEKAGAGDKTAIKQANKAQVGKSTLETVKSAQAASRKTDAEIMEGFSEALSKATKILNDFTGGLNAFLEKSGLGKLLGGMAGVGSVLGTAAAGPVGLLGTGAGAISRALGIGNRAAPDRNAGGEANILPGFAGGGSSAAKAQGPGSPAASQGGPKPANAGTAQKFIDSAKKYLGKPYVFGQLDCSGLVQYAYKSATGVELPHRATSQYYMGQQVPKGKEQPGDTVYWERSSGRAAGNPTQGKGYKHHTAIYLGGGKIIAAPQPGENVKIQNLWGDYEFARLPGLGGAVSMADSAKAAQEKTQTQDTPSQGTGDQGALGGGPHGDAYGSIGEYDALAAAMAGGARGGSQQASDDQKKSTVAAAADAAAVDPNAASAGNGPWPGKDGETPKNLSAVKAAVQRVAAGFGWGSGAEWSAIDYIVQHESSWNPGSVNSIGASGLFQAYPGNKQAAYGSDWKTNPVTQAKFGMNYIKGRYKDPVGAQKFWAAHHWYEKGAMEIPNDQQATLHKGEMVLDKNNAEAVRQALVRNTIPSSGTGVGVRGTGAGGGGGVTLNFESGAICINPSGGSITDEEIKGIVRRIGEQVDKDTRIQRIAGGR